MTQTVDCSWIDTQVRDNPASGWSQAMSYATMMVHVDFEGKSDARTRLAADLASRFNAKLIGVAGWAPRPPLTYGGTVVDAELSDSDILQMTERLGQCGEQFRAVAGLKDNKIDWRFDIAFPSEVVIGEARAADLVIVGRDRAPGDHYRTLDAGTVLLKVGRPVLVVPEKVDRLRAQHVVIGWKETREARRAVQDALAFCHDAERVTIVEVCDRGAEEQARRHIDDVAQYLAQHRVKVTARIIAHDKSPADEFFRVAKNEDADLIVAGAYGHSRLGEWIFGGVTRDLLTRCPVCCLLSH